MWYAKECQFTQFIIKGKHGKMNLLEYYQGNWKHFPSL